jgi:hypothetical protein
MPIKGFRFILKNRRGKKIYWACEFSRGKQCKVTAQTDMNNISVGLIYPSANPEEHNHPPKGIQRIKV